LSQASTKLGEVVDQAAQPGGAGQTEASSGDDDVVDAEFEDVQDQKRAHQ
jgi:molecular chaperone DnaK